MDFRNGGHLTAVMFQVNDVSQFCSLFSSFVSCWRNKLRIHREKQIGDLLAFLFFHLQQALLIWKQLPSGTNGELFHILLGTCLWNALLTAGSVCLSDKYLLSSYQFLYLAKPLSRQS